MAELTTLALLAIPFVIVAVFVVRALTARPRAYRNWVSSLPAGSSNRPRAELVTEWKSQQRSAAERYQAESRAAADAAPVIAVLDPHQDAAAMPTAVAVPGPPRTNTMAILALIFGIGGGLLAIVFGHVALSQISKSGESGRGMAIAGLVLGYLTAAILLALLVLLLLSIPRR